MYEDMTFDLILNRMLARVPNSIDKREGSVIYDALAPAAAELAQMHIELDKNLKMAFAGTSGGRYLELRTDEMGIQRQPAAKARRKGLFFGIGDTPIDVPTGSRFSIESLNYTVISKLGSGQFIMECETAGTIGNRYAGIMLPIDYISGLVHAELADVLDPGEDEETDEKLLDRYRLRVRQPATSGNAYQYRQWVLEVHGVGDAKVFPLWNGPGTVKVVIVDTDKLPAGAVLVAETAEHIEAVRPVGAAVTVVSGRAKQIGVSAKVVLAAGCTLQNVTDSFTSALSGYFKSVAFEVPYISYAKIGTLLLTTPGVLDYSDLYVNGATANVAVSDEETGVAGTVSLGV